MTELKTIKTALVSTFHKNEALEALINALAANGVTFISTGGTRSFIEALGHECAAVDDLTGYPAILGGRVKTLHPKVFGAILNRRDDEEHRRDTARYGIPDIDLVIVDLYPFEQTVATPGATEHDIIEKIDIGGISLIRAAAKNFNDVAIVASQAGYGKMLDILSQQGANTTRAQRLELARDAFAVSSGYDSAIFNYFAGLTSEGLPPCLRKAVDGRHEMRYGENPHQQGVFYGRLSELFDQLHGKELSYNNLLDIDASLGLIAEFGADEPACAVVKHNNPCGVAIRPTAAEAWDDALAGDPESAFGGIVTFNCEVTQEVASKLDAVFFEVVAAPAFTDEALATLGRKKNRIILRIKEMPSAQAESLRLRSCLNGVLAQSSDARSATNETWEPMTDATPSAAEMTDLEMAERIVKHCKSNAISIVKNRQLVGVGAGQTSRVEAVRQAIAKARKFGLPVEGAALASDAFFPFDDSVRLAHEAGIGVIVQPGGSVRDSDSIAYCNAKALPMMRTSTRHFRH